MTDELHCPWCGTEVEQREHPYGTTPYICPNKNCEFCWIPMPIEIWQALIDGKKAQDALKVALGQLNRLSIFGENAVRAACKTTLEKITSITKQENE